MTYSILVPMDDSPPAKAALKHTLSVHSPADITVLHVIDTTSMMAYGGGIALKLEEYTKEHAEKIFIKAKRLAEDYRVELSTVIESGPPAHTINDFIRNHQFDHVIIGSHGRTGVSRLLFGSVAEQVVRQSPVPVTVVQY